MIAKPIPDACMDPESPHDDTELRRLYRLLISHVWDDAGLAMLEREIMGAIGAAVAEGNEMVIEHLKLVGMQP